MIIAGVLFSDSIIAWQDEPMAINVVGSDSVRLLDFPAVTVCQDENDNYMDRWYFIEALLNMIDLQCQKCKLLLLECILYVSLSFHEMFA